MHEPRLIEQLSQATGLTLADARKPELRRNVLTSAKEARFYDLLSLPHIFRIAKLYYGLHAARLRVKTGRIVVEVNLVARFRLLRRRHF